MRQNSVKFCLKCEIGISECGVGMNFKPLSSKEIKSGVRDKIGCRLQMAAEVEEEEKEEKEEEEDKH